ncbi:MAG TPA: GTPase Era [Actinomycetota bacterium]|nr:GTPase Era [Actinomycetota bacterium]
MPGSGAGPGRTDPPGPPFRSGFVAVVGRPNVGKSSLVNGLVGRKVSIVSDKPQTTRFAVRGVLNGAGYQAVFTDTPGYHKPRTPMGDRLNRRVEDTVAGVDAVLLVVDAAAGVGRGDAFVASREVEGFAGPKLCAVNKVDLLRHPALVPQLQAAADLAGFDHVTPVSARTGQGLDGLRELIVDMLPAGARLFPEDAPTDLPLELRVAEAVREKALALTREEVPHSIAVEVEELDREDGDGLVRISAVILVERDSQKGIVIGKGGSMLKEIGTLARRELEGWFGAKVFLDLRVKVLKDWQRDPRALDRLGF